VSGLSAIVHLDGTSVDPKVLAKCNVAAAHRGRPVATHLEGATAFAYLSQEDAPPSNVLGGGACGRLSIVLSGRLYGRDELAAATDAGAERRDPALILTAYRRWGADCLERLDGDFAFVLHDAERNVVLCARDALGMHPLCYAFDGRRLVAASEPRQVLAAGVATVPCEESIAAYIAATRHLSGGPRTFYRDVFRVEPGHLLEVDARGTRSRRYWQLDPGRQIDEHTDEEMAGRVRELLTDAVSRRVPDTGPYSCALTGGFDSSSVAALFRRAIRAREAVEAPLETFSFELRDPASDEPELIEAVSKDLGTNHHHIYLDQDNVFAVLPQMLAACDEPILDMGLLYLWRKKERAAQHRVRVMLSGLGGDELFVGQFHYLSDLLKQLRLSSLWSEVRGVYPIDRSKNMRTSLQKILQYYVVGPLIPRPIKRLGRRVATGRGAVPPWVDPGLARRVGLEDRLNKGPERLYADAYRQDCFEVFTSSLVNTTLPLHEALGAAFGIETRFPILDRRLVEYMFAAPREQKIQRGQVRLLQRRAMKGILPEVVLTRHVKKNLNPVLRRQQHGNFVVEAKKLFSGASLRCEAYLDRTHLRRSYGEFLANRGGDEAALPLWYALNLERWLEGLER
jgi:asparagine synthase (glutamine-hydrolysing)